MMSVVRPAAIAPLLLALFVGDWNSGLWADEVRPLSPFGQMVTNLNPANWRMPSMPSFKSLMPRSEEKEIIKRKRDSLVDEVGKTASGSWSRTKQALNPQRFYPTNFFPASARTPSTPEPTGQQPGFFGWLFSPPVPDVEDPTTSGFLKQQRPSP